MHKYTNNLIHESSPYLLQHAHNPVNWYPWGDEALKKAGDENKMLIISIGYSSCHWCHVMEHESFEDTTVARIMNEHFVSIKVDREERPDIDQLYMNAAYIMTGSGGWPLNVLALPDGKPFYAGTYFTRDNWIKVLEYFIDMQNNDPSGLVAQAENITKGIRSLDNIVVNQGTVQLKKGDFDEAFTKLRPYIDFKKGGINRAPKFPVPATWEYLLHYYSLSNDDDALKAVVSTLDNMASGGIYDHIGGGFARYSTDESWHVPHFEKMLYDNAQLISLYTHAWQLTKNPLYRQVVFETIDFIDNEMTSPDGGFYSSLDADSDGGEGKFYVWTKKEIVSALGKEASLFIDYYNITDDGNWENGQNILYRSQSNSDVVRKYNIDAGGLKNRLDKSRDTLMKVRGKRVRPGLDDKILTSWNALMLKGYVDAYRAFGEERFLKAALANAYFLTENAINQNNEITRNSKSGKSSVPGMLDDYAFTVSAFIDLYQATFDEKWLYRAKELAEYTIQHFSDSASGMFWYTSDDHSELIARKMEITDNVIPSSNSEMAMNLYLLGMFFDNEAYTMRARQMLKNVNEDMTGNIFSYANWGRLGIHSVRPLYEVAIVGPDWDAVRKTMDNSYLPDAIFLGGRNEGTLSLLRNKLVPGQTTIYVCADKTCRIPVTDAEQALKQMK
ncbi:MAG: thioredoxin domain-containing protein [Bacteroidales bacterium]|nr:thioredoxin domain-containing protein [Bacteroidales bacterium]MDT8374239.1 thioredoxin domain-containing protein [Bacteroidales bacterium]